MPIRVQQRKKHPDYNAILPRCNGITISDTLLIESVLAFNRYNSHFYNDTENTYKFIVLKISDFYIRVVPRFLSSFSSFGRCQIEVILIQPLTAFAFEMILSICIHMDEINVLDIRIYQYLCIINHCIR